MGIKELNKIEGFKEKNDDANVEVSEVTLSEVPAKGDFEDPIMGRKTPDSQRPTEIKKDSRFKSLSLSTIVNIYNATEKPLKEEGRESTWATLNFRTELFKNLDIYTNLQSDQGHRRFVSIPR